MSDERTKEELMEENQRLRERLLDLQEYVPQVKEHAGKINTKTTRRTVLGSLVGGVGLHLALGRAKAQTLGDGEIGSQANPALRVYVNRVHFVDLGSDPSSPEDGSMYYNSNA